MAPTTRPARLSIPGSEEESDLVPVDEAPPAENGQKGAKKSVDEDITPGEWLAGKADKEETFIQWVSLPSLGVRMKLAAITDEEQVQIERQSRRRDPQTRAIKMDSNYYKRLTIATSLNKAAGKGWNDEGAVFPEQLADRPTGELNTLMKEVLRISGQEEQEQARINPSDLFI